MHFATHWQLSFPGVLQRDLRTCSTELIAQWPIIHDVGPSVMLLFRQDAPLLDDASGVRYAWHPIQAPLLAGGLPHPVVCCSA